MPAKKLMEKINEEAKIVDLLPLFNYEEYKGNSTRHPYKCLICEHLFTPSPSNVQRGQGCPNCAGNIKNTWENLLRDAEKVNVLPKFDYGQYTNSSMGYQYQCTICKHEYETKPAIISRGYGCPKCAGVEKKTMSELVLEARRVNLYPDFEYAEYKGNKYKHKYVCLICKYPMYKTTASVYSGNGCAKCHKNARKTMEELISDALKVKLFPLYNYCEYQGVSKTYLYRCLVCKKEYFVKPNNITSNKGCRCINKYTQDEVCKIFKFNNLEILEEYSGIENKISCRCLLCQTIQYKSLSAVKRYYGNHCGNCGRRQYVMENRIKKILEKIFNTTFIKCRPKLNKAPNGQRLEFDGYAASERIAFECQDHYHCFNYKSKKPIHQKNKVQFYDYCKRKNAIKNKIYLLIIKDTVEDVEIEKEIKNFVFNETNYLFFIGYSEEQKKRLLENL